MFGRRSFILVGAFLLLGVAWWAFRSEPGQLRQVRLLLGTTVEIVAEHPEVSQLETAVTAAFDEIARIERLMDPDNPGSDLARLSEATTACEVSADTARVIALGQAIAERSGGAFDMSLGRLKALWGLESDQPQVPSEAAIQEALVDIGPRSLLIEGRMARKAAPQLQHDLGGIAKGYAVDRAIAILREHGVTSAAVNAGGDMYLLGGRKERAWRIGIQHPRRPDAVLVAVDVRNRAVVTSGDYERFFERDGQRYHHLFDPATGAPARLCQSVSVVAETVAEADALATALFVLGPADGVKLLASFPGADALFVMADGTLLRSPGWQDAAVAQAVIRE